MALKKLRCSWCKKFLIANTGGLKTKFFCSRPCFRKARAKELNLTHQEYCDKFKVGPNYERGGHNA